MRTFCIQTLGCKVNAYEGEQIAAHLRSRGLTQTPGGADLRIVHTCSVTVDAASKSRQTIRRMNRLPVLGQPSDAVASVPVIDDGRDHRTIVTGCWATSNRADAAALAGVDAVITHHENVAEQLDRLLDQWMPDAAERAGAAMAESSAQTGMRTLPLLGDRQATHQRALLKVQDGCDAHCTYCIIPTLRPALYSKPIDEVVEEARRMAAAGHVELVLTGIFLGAYGQPTALRRRQPAQDVQPIAALIDALCTRVPGLLRLRLSSLEPGDLNDDLIRALSAHEQVVPHLHLPLQSGSDAILRKMNRQYGRDDYRRMIDTVQRHFNQPAITTDVIVGFPGESDDDFAQTVEICRQARFIHIHAFSFSPRPGTAAARWKDQYISGTIAHERIDALREISQQNSLAFRSEFAGQMVRLLVERDESPAAGGVRHGRCERYFDVHFDGESANTGDLVEVRIDEVLPNSTFGTLMRTMSKR